MRRCTYTFRRNDTHFVIPATRGIQGNKCVYSAMLPMRQLSEMVPPVSTLSTVEERSQRKLNKRRAFAIAEYIHGNPETYVLPALTVSLLKTGQRRVQFEPIEEGGCIGELHIPIAMDILLNDGQHRHAAITELLGKHDLRDSIALTIYSDVEKEQADQMFVDINLNAVKPSGSINTLYNHRDPWSRLAVKVSKKSTTLNGRTEYEKASCTGKNENLFPLKSIVTFCKTLTASIDSSTASIISKLIDQLGQVVPEWQNIDGEYLQACRSTSLATTTVMLEAIGQYVRQYASVVRLRDNVKEMDVQLAQACDALKGVTWDKDASMWQGRVMHLGKIVKNKRSVTLACNALLNHAGIPLSPDMENEEVKFIS